jgi:hypothetical protein
MIALITADQKSVNNLAPHFPFIVPLATLPWIPKRQSEKNGSWHVPARRMENEGVVLTATNTLMAELAQDWSRPEGGQLLDILFNEVLPKIG